MKTEQFLGSITAASVLAGGLVIAGGGAASAGALPLYSKTCSGSNVATKATGQNTITFNAVIPNVGARTVARGTNSGSTTTQYVYWTNVVGSQVTYVSSGSVSNAGTLSSAAWFCDY